MEKSELRRGQNTLFILGEGGKVKVMLPYIAKQAIKIKRK
jgi:hypothetical protein